MKMRSLFSTVMILSVILFGIGFAHATAPPGLQCPTCHIMGMQTPADMTLAPPTNELVVEALFDQKFSGMQTVLGAPIEMATQDPIAMTSYYTEPAAMTAQTGWTTALSPSTLIVSIELNPYNMILVQGTGAVIPPMIAQEKHQYPTFAAYDLATAYQNIAVLSC